MTRPSDTEAVTLTDAERAELGRLVANGYLTRVGTRALIDHVEGLLAARLAGAGAQVTEAAVSAAAEAMRNIGPSYTFDSLARAALSAALPHLEWRTDE